MALPLKSEFPFLTATLVGQGVVGAITAAKSSKGQRPCQAWKISPRQNQHPKESRGGNAKTPRGETRGSGEGFYVSATTLRTVTDM